MGSFSIWHWLIVLVVVVLIFGTKKLRNLGTDLGGAVKGFKEGMKTEDDEGAAGRCREARALGRGPDGRGRGQGQDQPRSAVSFGDLLELRHAGHRLLENCSSSVWWPLIVIGPERLPRVARTAGHLLGRFQRYVSDVKADINREIELAELKKLQSSVEDAARSIEQSVKSGVEDAQKEFEGRADGTGKYRRGAEEDRRRSAAADHGRLHDASYGNGRHVQRRSRPARRSRRPTPGALVAPTQASGQSAESAHASGETIIADDEGPSPQLELGLDPSAQPAAQKQA